MCNRIIFNEVFLSYKPHVSQMFTLFLLEPSIVNEIDRAILKFRAKKPNSISEATAIKVLML